MKIITTVGTSVFTNIIKRLNDEDRKNDEITAGYSRLEDTLYSEEWERLKNRDVKDLKEAIEEEWKKRTHNQDDSAEIKSIMAIAGELKEDKEDVEVYLLATDTVLSVLACRLIMEWFENNPPQFAVSFKVVGTDDCLTADKMETMKDKLVVKDLRVMSNSSSSSADNIDDATKIDDATINSGFLNLIDKIQAIIKPGQRKREGGILNISGGYKAFIPILTIMGQLYNIPLKYIYEGSNRLVSIDQFPINFDWGMVDLLMPYLNNLSSVQQQEKVIAQLEKFHLVAKGKDDYVQSSMGKLLKKFYDGEMPTSMKVVGPFVEYKLYEYFHEYYRNVLSAIKRDVHLREENKDLAEIDLQLTSTEGKTFACEVKSFNQVQNKHFDDQILKKARSRVSVYSRRPEKLTWYILVFYKLEGQPIDLVLDNLTRLKSSLRELKVEFKACYLNLPLTDDNNGINYQKFVQDALKKEKLKEIDLDKSTSSKIVEDTFKL